MGDPRGRLQGHSDLVIPMKRAERGQVAEDHTPYCWRLLKTPDSILKVTGKHGSLLAARVITWHQREVCPISTAGAGRVGGPTGDRKLSSLQITGDTHEAGGDGNGKKVH